MRCTALPGWSEAVCFAKQPCRASYASGYYPERGATPHTGHGYPPDPISSLQKRTIKTTHKSALVALTSVASPADPHFSLPEKRQRQPSSCARGFRGVLYPLDYAEDAHLVAQGGEKNDELDGVGRIRQREVS